MPSGRGALGNFNTGGKEQHQGQCRKTSLRSFSPAAETCCRPSRQLWQGCPVSCRKQISQHFRYTCLLGHHPSNYFVTIGKQCLQCWHSGCCRHLGAPRAARPEARARNSQGMLALWSMLHVSILGLSSYVELLAGRSRSCARNCCRCGMQLDVGVRAPGRDARIDESAREAFLTVFTLPCHLPRCSIWHTKGRLARLAQNALVLYFVSMYSSISVLSHYAF